MSIRAHTVPKFLLAGFASPETTIGHEPSIWIASLKTGEISRRSPKNVSIVRGFYDGPGGFSGTDASVEVHLAKIEREAAKAIRRMALEGEETSVVPQQVWRFVAWQAARTPGFIEIVERAANELWDTTAVESPPIGFEKVSDRQCPLSVEAPEAGELRQVDSEEEFHQLLRKGWKWKLRSEDRLEAIHMQAWYFQVRHFPRLSWLKLTAPKGECFIISDRGAAWMVDGYANTPPSALRDRTAQIVAPLTPKIALVGRYGNLPLNVTPRAVNRFVAFASDAWIAGPNREVLEQALSDRRTTDALTH
ncbi:DUF4238 domain-containing protein [Mesorhizobium sp. ASY16-5R]|uniref:DUF4238 domain-containing protein n=1 Tax=Mesorhizobium sp. ASY16-5R TaxID=3445772 RepID=UPI003F9FC854